MGELDILQNIAQFHQPDQLLHQMAFVMVREKAGEEVEEGLSHNLLAFRPH